MAYDQFLAVGATSQMIEVPLRSSSTGQLLTGVAYGDLTATYIREGATSETSVAPVTMTQGTYVSGGWIETGIAGVYQFGIPNAALAAGAKAVTLVFSASGAIDVVKRVVLVVEDLRDALVSSRLAAASYSAPPSASDNATAAAYAVWNENMADHLGQTTTGGRLNLAAQAGPVGDMIEAVGYNRFKTTALENMPAAVGLATANLDAQLAGLPTAAAAAILAAADSDPISANVTYSAGVAVSGRLAEVTDLPSEPLDATATQAAAAAALTAYDPPTKAELDAGLLALVGGDGDTLESLSDQIDLLSGAAGSGAITFVYTLTSSVGGAAIADADVWVTSDVDGNNVLASGRTDQNGAVTFYLDAGTVYVWRQKSGWNFDNPDTEVVA